MVFSSSLSAENCTISVIDPPNYSLTQSPPSPDTVVYLLMMAHSRECSNLCINHCFVLLFDGNNSIRLLPHFLLIKKPAACRHHRIAAINGGRIARNRTIKQIVWGATELPLQDMSQSGFDRAYKFVTCTRVLIKHSELNAPLHCLCCCGYRQPQ